MNLLIIKSFIFENNIQGSLMHGSNVNHWISSNDFLHSFERFCRLFSKTTVYLRE